MNAPRTITALEHEIIPILKMTSDFDGAPSGTGISNYFTEAEAQALLRINDLRRGFCQRVSGGVKLAQYCGIVRLQTCVLEVLPKVGMVDARGPDEVARSRTALLTMLHNARQLSIARVGAAPQQAVHAPLLEVFIEAFLHCALEQARRGLLSRYMPHEDNLPVLKGRFNAHGHFKNNLASPHLLNCQYDEFTPDNGYNRAIKATLEACRTWINRSTTQRLWFETYARFASVSLVHMSQRDVSQLPRDRTTRRYEPVLAWCEWLLSMASPALSTGTANVPGLLFDMNKLFEAYVGGLVEAAAGDSYIVHRQGPEGALAKQGDQSAFRLKPDITVWQVIGDGAAGCIVRIIDAKWKRLDPQASQWGVDQDDVYQMLAYAVHYRCERLELIYPVSGHVSYAAEEGPLFKIPMCGNGLHEIQVQIKMVRLWDAL